MDLSENRCDIFAGLDRLTCQRRGMSNMERSSFESWLEKYGSAWRSENHKRLPTYSETTAPIRSLPLLSPCVAVLLSTSIGPTWPKPSGTSNLDTKFSF